jgi:hypothetical protein
MAEISVDHSETVPQAPTMNLQDLVYLINIVDVASRRGAFKGEELSAVGAVYDKVVSFLKTTGAIVEPESANEQTNEKINSKRSSI